MKYEFTSDGKMVSFDFKKPFSVQPVTQEIFGSIIYNTNNILVKDYISLKDLFSINSNDPNEIYNSINNLCIHQDQIDAQFYDSFYKLYKKDFGKIFGSVFKEEYRQYIATFLQYKLRQFTGMIDQIVNSAFRVAGGALK
jgi:hypothetical protein